MKRVKGTGSSDSQEWHNKVMRISGLKENQIFVFGSNLAGTLGGGAARLAYEFWCYMGSASSFPRSLWPKSLLLPQCREKSAVDRFDNYSGTSDKKTRDDL